MLSVRRSDWRPRIEDILDAIDKILRFTERMSFEEFEADDRTTYAVAMAFAIIGEAARHVPDAVQKRYADVPWVKMRSMRNVLIHDYPGVSWSIVWDTARNDLPPLVPRLRQILENGPNSAV